MIFWCCFHAANANGRWQRFDKEEPAKSPPISQLINVDLVSHDKRHLQCLNGIAEATMTAYFFLAVLTSPCVFSGPNYSTYVCQVY